MIELTGPICNCDEGDLGWYPVSEVIDNNRTGWGLNINCKKCGTTLNVSHKKFVARIKLDVPYPAKKAEPKPKAELKVLEGGLGKLIPFPNPAQQNE